MNSVFGKHFMGKILIYILTLVVILTVFGFLGKSWWVFDLMSHFRVQYFVALSFLGIFFIKERKWKKTFLAFAFALVNFSLVLPYGGMVNIVAQADQSEIKILSMNLDHRNASYKAARSVIDTTNPSVLVLQELSADWDAQLEDIFSKFPHSIKRPYDNFYRLPEFIKKRKLSLGIFSHLPFEVITVEEFNDNPIPYLGVRLKFKEKQFSVFGVHLTSPVGKVRTEARNKQLGSLVYEIQKNNQPTIIVGDFNITPWSPYFKDFIQRSELLDTRKGLGVYPTWPKQIFPLMIPIDHGLVSSDIKLHSFNRGPNFGSDHLPLILNFSIS